MPSESENKAFLVGAVKSVAVDTFEGWASTASLDRQGDVVLPDAFTSSLKAFLDNGPIYWNHAEMHDPLAKPIGRAIDAKIARDGLYMKAKWARTPEAEEVRGLVSDGIVKSLSIGFRPRESRKGEGGANVITDLELLEVSVVAIPANPSAVITASKALDEIAPPIPDDPPPPPPRRRRVIVST